MMYVHCADKVITMPTVFTGKTLLVLGFECRQLLLRSVRLVNKTLVEFRFRFQQLSALYEKRVLRSDSCLPTTSAHYVLRRTAEILISMVRRASWELYSRFWLALDSMHSDHVTWRRRGYVSPWSRDCLDFQNDMLYIRSRLLLFWRIRILSLPCNK
jgi:hypothetical protein